MPDIYRIGVAIGMTDNASGTIQALGRGLLGLNLKIKDVEGGLNRVKVAALGLGAVLAGIGVLRGWDDMAKAGDALVKQQIAMANAGMTHLEIVKETAEVYKSLSTVRGPDVADRLGALKELRGIVGAGPGGHDYREINALLPDYLKARALLGEKGSNQLFRTVEQQGGARYDASGKFDEERFKKYMDAGLRTIQASGGNIKASDLLSVMQMSSVTARGYDPNAFWNLMMTPMLEMGGHRAGTAVTAMSRAFYGGIMPERNARELDRLGLFKHSSIMHMPHLSAAQRKELHAQGYEIGRGGVVMIPGGAVRGSKELNDPNQGFFPWVKDTLGPLLRADYKKNVASRPGNTESYDAYIRDEMYKALPTETARRIAALLLTQTTSVQRDQTLRSQAVGTTAYQTNQQSYTVQIDNLHKSWESLMQTLGAPAARDGATILRAIGTGLDRLTQWTSTHPDAAKWLERLALGIGAITLASGAAAVAGVALGPLASGIKLLVGALAGSEVAAASRAAATLGAVSGPGSLFAVAGGMVALAAATPMIAKSLEGFADWADSKSPFLKNLDKRTLDELYSLFHPTPVTPGHSQNGFYGSRIPAGMRNGGAIQKESYEVGSGQMMQPINITFQVDGRTFAQTMTQHQTRLAMPGVQVGTNGADFLSQPMPAGLRTA